MGMDFKADAAAIRAATKNSLALAERLGCSSIAFPALGCGVGGFPAAEAADIMIEETCRLLSRRTKLQDVRFVLFDTGTFGVFDRAAERILAPLARKTFRNPFPTVDILIESGNGIILIRRKNPPPGWALPGGFVDPDESAEHAAIREAREETGLALEHMRQFGVYSEPGRDPRFHTISTVFVARGAGIPAAADDAAEIGVFAQNALPEPIAFDHRKIIGDYFRARKIQK